jgi:site-specific DNA-methyltransferase (adenine-specific)
MSIQLNSSQCQLYYEHANGKLYQGNSIDWLSSLENESVDLVFADPPYNIKKANWDHFASQDAYIEWSMQWIKEVSRILKSSGSFYICGFSEILADIKKPAMAYFKQSRWLIWHYKNKANLGRDWGRSHESIIHFRKSHTTKLNIDDVRIPYSDHTLKYPSRLQAESSAYGKSDFHWHPHPKGAKPKDVIEMPTICNGMAEKTPHPTQKPEALLRKFVLASSKEGDWVVDPFSGSGTTLVVAEQLNRKWLGCDHNIQYNLLAIDRIKNVVRLPKEEWIALDCATAKRRTAIR